MSNCINHKHPDVINMANTAGLSPAVIAAKIMLWQESNGLDNWPTINDLGLGNNIKPGVSELFESNFFIFEESTTSEEIINKLINNKIIEKKCD